MPSGRTRSKDDTWTTDELSKALKTQDGERRKIEQDDEDRQRLRDERSERRRNREDMNESTSQRKKRPEDDDKRRYHQSEREEVVKLTEDERERLRKERRAKLEKDSSNSGRKKDEKQSQGVSRDKNDVLEQQLYDHEKERHHLDDDQKKYRSSSKGHIPRSRNDEDGQRHSKNDGDSRKKQDDSRRHRDDDDYRRQRDGDSQKRNQDDGYQRKHKDEDDRKRHREDGDRKKKRDKDGRSRYRDADDRKKLPEDEDHGKHRDDDDRRKHRDDDERRKHRNDDDRKKYRDDGDRKKHRDDDIKLKHRDEEDTKRHRDDKERKKHREDDDRKTSKENVDNRKHRDIENDEDRKSKRTELDEDERDRQRRERREKREKHGKDKKEKRGKENEERNTDEKKSKSKHSLTESASKLKLSAEASPLDDYDEEPNYEDDFEDYEDDFEEEDPQPEGEVESVLRALNEENNRLLNTSRYSNRSDSTEFSEEQVVSVKRSKETEKQDYVRKQQHSVGIFNFVSAKQRVMSQKLMGKTQKRAHDLKKILELDISSYDLFELPPVKEYDSYICSFGRSNSKQAYVQTNDDNIDRDIQTEEIESRVKWTQHPSEDIHGCGGDGIEIQPSKSFVGSEESAHLSQFISRTGQTIGILLSEERVTAEDESIVAKKTNLSWSNGFFQLGIPPILAGRVVKSACFCPDQTNMLLTIHTVAVKGKSSDLQGLLCVWNVHEPALPYRILTCESQPSCCCFSPTSSTLVFAGMVDGSVVAWDLREPNSMHQRIALDDNEFVLRHPTYSTARVLEEENHHSPVMSIVPVYSLALSSKESSTDSADTSGLSFQLATLEETGIINLWVVVEIMSPDTAGSQVDLGLAPGGKIKLVKSSSIKLECPAKDIQLRTNLRTFDLQLRADDLNHYYVGTDMGHIIHGVRFGSRPFPRSHRAQMESPVQIRSIDFSPFGCPYFLAGCDDGSILLFHTKLENPIITWPPASSDLSVLCVQWSLSRPAVFYVLDNKSVVSIYDLTEAEMAPVRKDQIQSGKAISLTLSPDTRAAVGTSSYPPQLFLSMDTGNTEIHSISKQFTEQQTLELEFLENYVDRF